MDNKINIIITHKGNAHHLRYVLDQVNYTNPDANIVLLGDESNNKYSFIKHANLKDYFESATKFKTIYRHMNKTPYEFELFCYQRWFCIYEYMKQNNLDDVICLDSDVLVFEDLKELHRYLKEYKGAICIQDLENPDGLGDAIPSLAYFKKDLLKEITDFIVNSYTNSFYLEKLEKKEKHSGVCDMNHLWLFYKENQEKMLNLIVPFYLNTETIAIDSNIHDITYFKDYNNLKLIKKEKGKMYAFSKFQNQKIRLPIIHFQGYGDFNTKILIPIFYTAKRYKLRCLLERIKFYKIYKERI